MGIDYLISNIRTWQRELRRSESAESTEQDMVLLSEGLSRSLKSPNTLDIFHHSAERTPLREKLSASGNAKNQQEDCRWSLSIVHLFRYQLQSHHPTFEKNQRGGQSRKLNRFLNASDTQNKQVVYMSRLVDGC